MPSDTRVPQHTHGFSSWFMLLLGFGATVNCAGKTIKWRMGFVHKVPAAAEHGLYAPFPLLFVSFQSHQLAVTSASEDFQLV
ncbi:MAG: hypothetical protein EBR82_45050 [Caulobacteraceae bacterium]|nr:hypothetical protein [Caulobacteraceae bacterium]